VEKIVIFMDSSIFIYQEISMYYLVNVDHNSMAVHSPEVTVNGFKNCCISNAVNETDDDMLWNGSEEDGKVRSEWEEDESTECEDGGSDTDW